MACALGWRAAGERGAAGGRGRAAGGERRAAGGRPVGLCKTFMWWAPKGKSLGRYKMDMAIYIKHPTTADKSEGPTQGL